VSIPSHTPGRAAPTRARRTAPLRIIPIYKPNTQRCVATLERLLAYAPAAALPREAAEQGERCSADCHTEEQRPEASRQKTSARTIAHAPTKAPATVASEPLDAAVDGGAA
jgi:hypothetical protein